MKIFSYTLESYPLEDETENKMSAGKDCNLGRRNYRGKTISDTTNNFSEKDKLETGLNSRRPM